eukprot:11192538-Lingulodinium_polyedra.AAC.1
MPAHHDAPLAAHAAARELVPACNSAMPPTAPEGEQRLVARAPLPPRSQHPLRQAVHLQSKVDVGVEVVACQ